MKELFAEPSLPGTAGGCLIEDRRSVTMAMSFIAFERHYIGLLNLLHKTKYAKDISGL